MYHWDRGINRIMNIKRSGCKLFHSFYVIIGAFQQNVLNSYLVPDITYLTLTDDNGNIIVKRKWRISADILYMTKLIR